MSTVFNIGDKVRYSANGEIGEITGKYQERLDRWQVVFNGVDAKYIPAEKLELMPKLKDVRELFLGGDFKTITDFRRRIYRYRMSGKLTNLMYSMDNAKTQFLPHQFIPVVRFLESYTDRLLIADEVGLGKTIEAMYIWEELVARKNAKRLLVVAPAVLREKWKGDIRRFFDIDAEIVSAQNANAGRTLLSSIYDARGNPARTAFVLIVSLEGLRSAEKVRETLEQCRDVEKVFDMTIIDEAHYMRNSPTESFKTGELLRDVSSHLVLLSATPIQTSSTNFFTLLNLLSPEDFEYEETFDEQLCENRPLVKIANSLECGDDEETIRPNIEAALKNPVFSADTDIRSLSDNLSSVLADVDKRVEMIGCIKSKYFYSGFVTRSRKRDVFPNRVTRNVASVNFHLNDYERQFYDAVTRYLQEQDRHGGQNNISTFRLITRQHQMSSSIPAALRAWRGYGVDDDFDEELNCEKNVDLARMVAMPAFDGFDLEKLERDDSKFDKVLAKIKNILEDNLREKIIIFSFFRNTVRYLYERLSAANVSATYIMGGVDMDEKQRRLAEFKDCDINVLVSSEVGSEGIDLQFARYELNYDLPWNPMRLEQRIGRIDRIGQKSPDIYICNAYCENTISDRILRRLYERIEEFRNVIGDLEEVIGEQVKNLEVDVFREHRELTDDDVKERAEQCVNAICHQRQITKSLELQAGNMASPHQEFILRNINKSYEAKRLITSDELMFFCRDILQEMYQGSSVACVGAANIADVRLSDAARREFTRFLTNTSMAYGTQLNSCPKGLRCGFGRKYSPSQCDEHVVEVVDVNHPLVRWLLSVVERNTIYTSGCEVVEVKRSKLPCDVKIEVGCYAYLIQHWESDGVRNINELRYCICRGIHDGVQEPVIIDGYDAERIMMSVVVDGSAYDVTLLQDEDFNACGIAMEHVDKHMEDDFCNFEELQKVRNSNLIEEQSRYIERTAAVKSSRIRAVVDKMRMELSQGLIQESAAGRHEGLIKANEKRIENIIAKRDERIARIQDKLDCNPTIEDVALGILFVTEG